MIDEHQPSTPTEVALVDIMTADIWKWHRLRRVALPRLQAPNWRNEPNMACTNLRDPYPEILSAPPR